ncbi:MAG: type II toxin-antitoxin system prevent-host-death family antitoxin [Blastochloris sp.]|nr:type II toxin-antitoxin system prevent-host-death family antitoxin [Blastochloris sp.]
MVKTVNLSEAKAHLGRYLQKAARGETILIAERNRPKARLMPLEDGWVSGKPSLRVMAGTFTVPEDLNAALSSLENDFYGT